MKLPSWYECLETAREASLEVAASLLDAHASLTVKRDRCGNDEAQHDCDKRRSAAQHHRDGGDFLFDWLRLNMTYASQAAMLGSTYAGIFSRGLSQLYARGPHRHAAPLRCEVELRARERGTGTGRLTIRNGSSESAKLVVGPLDNGRIRLPFYQVGSPTVVRHSEVTIQEESGRPHQATQLAPGEKRCLLVSLDFGAFEAGKQYRAELPVHLGGRSKPIHLVAEVFPSPPAGAP